MQDATGKLQGQQERKIGLHVMLGRVLRGVLWFLVEALLILDVHVLGLGGEEPSEAINVSSM